MRVDPSLPINGLLPALNSALSEARSAVIVAPPGAGKSTGVPPALLAANWLGGRRIVMLEPRRLAARAVAARIANQLGEPLGGLVGYRTRLDSKVSQATRLEVVTEGILTRALQRDPELAGVGLVIFDEFHERSLQADLGLALCLDVRRHLNPDLRLVVMSATIDGAAVARLLGAAPVLTAPGLAHPVITRYLERERPEAVTRQVAGAVRRALAADTGDILVFLPGAGEIRAVEHLLNDGDRAGDVEILPLYGDLSRAAQDRALEPAASGRRRVVLATNIAETSLTIEGVRVVIDSGLERRMRFDPRTGMSALETGRISRASADQRRGRAGRVGPGICYRLWTEAGQRRLSDQTAPEIVGADLAPLALDLANWGSEPAALDWLDAPPPGAYAAARDLLRQLGAIGTDGRITPHGREMTNLSAHPRLAHLLLRSRFAGIPTTGCALAALLGERDPRAGRRDERNPDIRLQLESLASSPHGGGYGRIAQSFRQFARQLQATDARDRIDPEAAGWLLACAFPDRIARRRAGSDGSYLLAGGRAAAFDGPQALARAEFIVIPELDAGERQARIYRAAPLTLADIRDHCAELLTETSRVAWNAADEAVTAVREVKLAELVVEQKALLRPPPEELRASMLAGLRQMGLTALPWSDATRQWQARVQQMRALQPNAKPPWPDVSDPALHSALEAWLGPFLAGCSRRDHLTRVDLAAALRSQIDWTQQRLLDEWLPASITVPSGSRIAIDYLDGDTPSVSVRLQEMFGLQTSPVLAQGRLPVLIKLLSPAGRPVQVTRDLASFWRSGYHEVRKELKGRYPKHFWPEDPLTAVPTRRAKPR